MDRFESMSAFVSVVQAGGFSAAARRVGTPLATLSRKVSDLEGALRVRLLTRTTRTVALTEAGQQFYETARKLLEELGEAERLASGEYRAPRGELAVSAPVVLGRLSLTPIINGFLAAYPDVNVDLRLADRVVNLVDEGVDVALRVAQLPDSSLRAVKVGEIRRVVCASPAYLAKHGVPSRPEELSAHECVTFTGFDTPRDWTFAAGQQTERYAVHTRLAVNMAEAAADAAMAGVGITRLLDYQVAAAIADGRLTLLLRDFEPAPLPVNLVYPGARLAPQKRKAFIDYAGPRIRRRLVFDA
jgi:DNA-binding transcriptional LysR family regulator